MNDRLGNTTLSIWEHAGAVIITTDAHDHDVIELNSAEEVEALIDRIKIEAKKAFGETTSL